MPVDFEQTELWKRTLGPQPDDPNEEQRARLRAAYLAFREAVLPLADQIAISMPMFTDHSIDHIDSLWEMASILMGDAFPINPAEAFVLGGTFLLHDLGMGLASYEEGEASIRKEPLYKDLVETAVQAFSARQLNDEQLEGLRAVAETEALVAVLRRRHARQAEALMTRQFKISSGEPFYLLENSVLRMAYGPLIGAIAHSHWFDVDDLPNHFPSKLGSHSSQPHDWDLDPLKLACILRLADASHIDSRRAPTYLSAFRSPVGLSGEHWYFQERLSRPRLESDRLVYTSTQHFLPSDSAAWWLCFNTVQMIDRELRRVDALCSDIGRPQFRARGVSGAESAERLANFIPVRDWEPVDARLKVSSVSQLVSSLGGRALYGESPTVALRELIANAVDSTSARLLQYRVGDAAVTVRLTEQAGEFWLEVEDTGLGMSRSRLLAALTDFGSSHWTSEDILADYPGLVAKGYKSIEKFGIGFYSIFMIADHVEVRSLKYRDGSQETSVLVFEDGVNQRPLLRRANGDEEIFVGGTLVRARLRESPLSEKGLFETDVVDGSMASMLRMILADMCALLEVDLMVQGPTETEPVRVVRGGAWKVMSPKELFAAVYVQELHGKSSYSQGWKQFESDFEVSVQDLKDPEGDIIGRAMIASLNSDAATWWLSPRAKIYVGGLAAGSLWEMLGAFVGVPLKADRSQGFPVASVDELKRWAVEQGSLLARKFEHGGLRALPAASVARSLGAPADDLPCGITASGPITPNELGAWLADKESVTFIPGWELEAKINTSGALVFREKDNGAQVELPANAMLLDPGNGWIFPEDVLDFPRDPRFANYGPTEVDVFNPVRWWYWNGLIGTPALVLRLAAEIWDKEPLEIVELFEDCFLTSRGDRRIEIACVQDEQIVRVDGFRLVRPSS